MGKDPIGDVLSIERRRLMIINDKSVTVDPAAAPETPGLLRRSMTEYGRKCRRSTIHGSSCARSILRVLVSNLKTFDPRPGSERIETNMESSTEGRIVIFYQIVLQSVYIVGYQAAISFRWDMEKNIDNYIEKSRHVHIYSCRYPKYLGGY